jgi:hypothetical protein
VVVSHIPDWQTWLRCGDGMTTKRGKEIENAVRVLERLLDAVPDPVTEADLQMFVKFWTAYAICKADHSARLLTSVNKNEEDK